MEILYAVKHAIRFEVDIRLLYDGQKMEFDVGAGEVARASEAMTRYSMTRKTLTRRERRLGYHTEECHRRRCLHKYVLLHAADCRFAQLRHIILGGKIDRCCRASEKNRSKPKVGLLGDLLLVLCTHSGYIPKRLQRSILLGCILAVSGS